MRILDERTEQLNIFCHVTGFTSDFLSFIDVELIEQFFHGALQFSLRIRIFLAINFTTDNAAKLFAEMLLKSGPA